MKMYLTITELSYQRNGIAGEGFYIVRFEHRETPRAKEVDHLIATIGFDDEGNASAETTRVIDPNDLSRHWRGDNFGYVLGPWVDENSKAAWPTLYVEAVKVLPAKVVG